MADLQDLKGTQTLREAWPKIEANEQAINNQVVNHDGRLGTAEAAVSDHGSRIAEAETKLVNQDNRITTIIAHNGDGTKDTELIDARGNEPLLVNRLNKTDTQLAESTQQVNTVKDDLSTNYAKKVDVNTLANSKAEKVELETTNSNVNATNLRVDELIINSGNANAEVTDAHVSTVKNKPFPTVRNRFEEIESDMYYPATNLIENGDLAHGLTGFGASGGTIAVVNGKIELTEDTATSEHFIIATVPGFAPVAGRKYYARAALDSAGSFVRLLYKRADSSYGGVNGNPSVYLSYDNAYAPPDIIFRLYGKASSYPGTGAKYYADKILFIDLTATFGTGNEPTHAEMDEIIAHYPNAWFDGTANLFNADYMVNKLKKVSASTTMLSSFINSTSVNVVEFGATGDGVSDDTVAMQSAVNAGIGKEVIFPAGVYLKKTIAGIAVPSNVTIKLMPGAIIKLNSGMNVDVAVFINKDRDIGNHGISIVGGKINCNMQGQIAGDVMAFDFQNCADCVVDTWIENYSVLEGKMKNSQVALTNRLFLIPDETPLFSCESVTGPGGFDTKGTLSTDHALGSHSLTHGVITATSSLLYFRQDHLFPNFLFDRPQALSFWIKFSDVASVKDFYYGVSSVSGDIIRKMYRPNKWYKVITHVITPSNTVSGLYFGATSISGAPGTTFWIDDIRSVRVNMRPAVSFGFDDAYATRFGAVEVMAKYGGKGMVHLNTGDPGVPTLLETDIMQKAYYQYGWDFSSHTVGHVDLRQPPFQNPAENPFQESPISLEQLEAELKDSRTWLENNGFKRGSGYFVYPFHHSDGITEEYVRKHYEGRRVPEPLTSSGVNFYGTRYQYVRSFDGLSSWTPIEMYKGWLRNHHWIEFFGHAVDATMITCIESLCSYLSEWGIKIETAREVMDKYQQELPHIARYGK